MKLGYYEDTKVKHDMSKTCGPTFHHEIKIICISVHTNESYSKASQWKKVADIPCVNLDFKNCISILFF